MSTRDPIHTLNSGYTPTEDDIQAYNEDQAKVEAERAAELKEASKPNSKLPSKLPKPVKPVRQPITIHVRGRERGTWEAMIIEGCEVYADVLAIRKLPKSRDFNITHVPTGLSIIDYVSPKAKAVECVAVLLEDGAEIWKFGKFGGSTQEELKPVLRMFWKARHIAHPENWNEDGTRVG